jgi:hypothetical protein
MQVSYVNLWIQLVRKIFNNLHVPDIQDNPAEQPQLNALHEDPYEPVEKHLTWINF